MTIRCGNRAKHATRTYHETIEGVRACFEAETWPCTWLYEARDRYGVLRDEDGAVIVRECGALAYRLRDGRGYTCEAGHEHIDMEARAAEGWEYAEDEAEAQRLECAGVRAVLA